MTAPELPSVSEATSHTPPARIVNWEFWVWVGCILVLTLGVAVVGAAWAARHTLISGERLSVAQQKAVLAVASFPGTMRDALQEFMWQFSDDPLPLLMERAATEKPYWVRHFPEPTDPGYLLFSGVDAKAKQSIVELIRISDGKSMARWVPDWKHILSNTHAAKGKTLPNIKTLRAIHPILMSNGDIVFNNSYSLIRMSICESKPLWQLDNLSHHSIELDSKGYIITLSKSDQLFPIANWDQLEWEDDSLAKISPSGVIVQNSSFAKILLNNNLNALFLGIGGGDYKSGDPIHLNQITPALMDSEFWKKDDLLISSRFLSTVFLYRPSTDKIIWYQTGPWMNQHSVEFLDNHRISVFNNNNVVRRPTDFVKVEDHNTVMVYDFNTGQTIEPFKLLLSEAKPQTTSEGRARILPDGGLFIEETNYGRLLRFSKDKLLWSLVNDNSKKNIGILSWSRYLTQSEVRDSLYAIESNKCGK